MRLLRAFLLFVRRSRWQSFPEWEEVDSRALASFISSRTGAKLMLTMQNQIVEANERAAMSKGSAFECGWACGYRGLFAWFQSLSVTPAVQEENEASPFGETAGLEQLSP